MIYEVPAPGSKFWEVVHHPDNVEILEGSAKSRRLPPDKLRKLRAEIAMYQAGLNAYWREYINRAQRLKRREKDKDRRARLDQLIAGAQSRIVKMRRTRQRVRIRTKQDVRAARVALHRLNARLEEHHQAIENQRINDRLSTEMRDEISFYSRQIIDRWSALGYREEYTDRNGVKRLRRVRFERCEYTEDMIQFKVFVSHLNLFGDTVPHMPDKVRAWDLVKPDTLAELEGACECPVTSPHTDENAGFEHGAWVIVHRVGMRDGLFNYITLKDVIAKYNQALRRGFAVPVGIKQGRVIEYLHLTKTPHLMLNGLPGSGKTNLARAWLCVWASFFSPDEIRFVLIDLKRSGDYNPFSAVPHLLTPIMKDIREVVEIAPRLLKEHQRRMNLLSAANAFDIDEYNARVEEAHRLPHVIILLDESGTIRDLAESAADRDSVFRVLAILAMQARASGIHVIIGSQQGSKEVIPPRIANNITYSISGRQRTMSGALGVMGNARTRELPAIQGRMLVDTGFDQLVVQSPHARAEDIRAAVEIAEQYPAPAYQLPDESAKAPDDLDLNEVVTATRTGGLHVTREDVIALALAGDGTMNAKTIYEVTGKITPRRQIETLIKSIIGDQEVTHEGQRYKVAPKGKGYKLIAVSA